MAQSKRDNILIPAHSTGYSNYDNLKTDYTALANNFYNDYLAQGQAATEQAYALRRKQQQDAQRDFYNQLYDTNETVLDTIRRNNANAIATGASKGAAAANELSAIIQGQQASVDAATQLAESNYDLASEEANAYITAEQQARQQADSAAGNLAGNLAVAAQADAAVESANISAQTQKDALEYQQEQLKQAINNYFSKDTTPEERLLAAGLITTLTGKDITEFESNYAKQEEKTNSNLTIPEKTEKNYRDIINKASYPAYAEKVITDAQMAAQETPELVAKVEGKNSTDLARGYFMTIIRDGKKYRVRASSLNSDTITYSEINNDVLRAVVDNAPNGYLIKVDDEYYVVDNKGQKTRQLLKVKGRGNRDETGTEEYQGLISGANIPDFTNKKNN